MNKPAGPSSLSTFSKALHYFNQSDRSMSAVLYHNSMMDHRKTGAFGESYNLKKENLDS
jgi:hypothetical protein